MNKPTTATIVKGDCLARMKAMASERFDLIVTDPPYEESDMSEHFAEMVRLLRPDGSIYVFGDVDMVAEHWFRQMKIKHKTLLIWHYANSPKPRGRWRGSMQAIIYGYKSASSVFHEDEARLPYMPATLKLAGRLRPSNGRLKETRAYEVSKGALPRDVILHPALLGHLSQERVGHPDQKPLGLIRKLVLVSSNPGDFVFDPFAGSGTTLVAARETDRHVVGIEKEAQWIEIAEQRISAIVRSDVSSSAK
jgi:DNA modification methylase